MPFSSSTGMAAVNGSETMTALASIMPMTVMVSSAQITRSVRGVGWCSMVRLAPRIHRPCAVGAISTGKPASTPTASPCPMPAAARPPAMRRARSWTSPQVWRTGSWGSPVTMPVAHGAGVAVHLLGESAHDNLLGFRSRRAGDIGPRANARV